MIRLLFVVPYPGLKEKVEYVIGHHPEKKELNAEVKVMTVEEMPEVPVNEYDAIIARGYTAGKTSEKYKGIPTIKLAISAYDLIRAMDECCKTYHSNQIAIIGFNRQLYEAEKLKSLFGVGVKIYASEKAEELSGLVNRAIADGCDAIIGGYSASIMTRNLKINSVIIQTGEATIEQALNEAINTVKQIRLERIVTQMYKTVIYSSKDGVLYVNAKGMICVRNRVATQMNGNISLMNQKLKKVLPYLYDMFKTVMETGQEKNGYILTIPGTKKIVSAGGTPVIVNNEINGVVINLSDITMIQDLESQIRQKLSERGLKARYVFEDIIHQSQTMERTIKKARRYAASDSNVIIVGETGTGKELFAQSIHNASNRKNGPFVAVNCAALPENLLESELFGYVEGAFTGTKKGGKMGLFEQAHGGTLFLDEIEEVTMAIQSKLLRVIQEKQVRRIGDNKVIDIDVRIISATNKSIPGMAEQGEFRKDLMYRLDVLRLFVPPLRNRENDVEILFQHLLEKQSKEIGIFTPVVDQNAFPLLRQYPFFGNIRELKNIMERTLSLKEGNVITADDLWEALYPQDLDMEAAVSHKTEQEVPEPVMSEREHIERALRDCGGNRTRTAEILKIDRSTLWRKIKKYKLE